MLPLFEGCHDNGGGTRTGIQSCVCNMVTAGLLLPFPGPPGSFGNTNFVVFIVEYNVPAYRFLFCGREKSTEIP